MSQFFYVLFSLLLPRNEVFKINQHDVNEVMETMCHGALEGGSIIFQTKGHYLIRECALRGGECSLLTVFFLDLDLVISRKPIHEGKDLMSGAHIDNLINEWCWEVVFGTCPI